MSFITFSRILGHLSREVVYPKLLGSPVDEIATIIQRKATNELPMSVSPSQNFVLLEFVFTIMSLILEQFTSGSPHQKPQYSNGDLVESARWYGPTSSG